MERISKKDKLLAALRSGRTMTAAQIVHRYGLASRNSAYAVISQLRQAGYPISGEPNRRGTTTYSM